MVGHTLQSAEVLINEEEIVMVALDGLPAHFESLIMTCMLWKRRLAVYSQLCEL